MAPLEAQKVKEASVEVFRDEEAGGMHFSLPF